MSFGETGFGEAYNMRHESKSSLFCISQLKRGLGMTCMLASLALAGCGLPPAQGQAPATDATTGAAQASSEGAPTQAEASSDTQSQSSTGSDDSSDSASQNEGTSEKGEGDGSTSQESTQGESSTSKDESSSGEEDKSTEAPADELQLLISVDWEGGTVRDKNIDVMEKMRNDFPNIPITHFLNAVYFIRPDVNKEEVAAEIRRTIRDGDELGLHIHGWQSLVEAAGVTYRSGPTYLDLNTEKLGDFGYTVDIGAYEIEELQKVIAFSVDTLDELGFGRAVSFRSGGWMGRNSVLIALAREGFLRDSSAVATAHFDDEFFTDTIWYQWLNELWPNIGLHSQPFNKTLKDGDEMRTILEIPDNGALADYVRANQMVQVYEDCLDYKRKHPGEHVTMNFGFHDVNAFRYLERVTDGLRLIQARAKKDKIKIVPVTSETMKFSELRRDSHASLGNAESRR